MTTFFRLCGLTILLIGLIGCGNTLDTIDKDALSAEALAGSVLFDKKCTACHSVDGVEKNAPTMQGIASIAGDRTELSAEEYLHQSIVDPSAFLVDGFKNSMPATYGDTYSEEEISQLITFLMTLQ